MNRVCGGCTLCCTLVPVQELDKRSGVKCRHVISLKGCSIYSRRPTSCQFWNCAWLVDDSTAALSRPDRSRYVIDIMRDHVDMIDNRTGNRMTIGVVQIWLDTARPLAHRDPKLRAWLEAEYERAGDIGIVRFNNVRALALIPPAFGRGPNDPAGWIEFETDFHPAQTGHTAP